MNDFGKRVVVCTCSHQKRFHMISARHKYNPCYICDCRFFTPEPQCKCGHGLKAHAKGPCHEGDCPQFRPV